MFLVAEIYTNHLSEGAVKISGSYSRIVLFAISALFISANALAEVVYSSLAGADGGWCTGAGTSIASGFHTPTGGNYRLDSIRVRLEDSGGGDPFAFDLYDDNAGLPGSLVTSIGSGNGNGTSTYDFYTLTPVSPVTLTANATYWIVISSSSGTSCTIAWSNGADPAGGIFTYVDEARDSGGGWAALGSPDYPQLEINATSLAAPTQIPTLSQWGMIILPGLLALSAVISLRRRHH